MTPQAEVKSWEDVRTRLIREWDSSESNDRELFDPRNLLEGYEENTAFGGTIRSLLLEALRLHQDLDGNVFSFPELYLGKALFVGDGAPRGQETIRWPVWLLPFTPHKSENQYVGSRFRRAIAEALEVPPRRCASFMNVRLIGRGQKHFERSEIDIIRRVLAVARPSAIVAVGQDANQQLVELIELVPDGVIWHPNYPLKMRQRQHLTRARYIEQIREKVARLKG
jgi:hypothetical protein